MTVLHKLFNILSKDHEVIPATWDEMVEWMDHDILGQQPTVGRVVVGNRYLVSTGFYVYGDPFQTFIREANTLELVYMMPSSTWEDAVEAHEIACKVAKEMVGI